MELTITSVFHIAIMIFLIIDAPKHGKSPVLWGILGFFFGFLSLGIYLIKTGRKVLGWVFIGLFILIAIIIIFIIVAFIIVIFSMSGSMSP